MESHGNLQALAAEQVNREIDQRATALLVENLKRRYDELLQRLRCLEKERAQQQKQSDALRAQLELEQTRVRELQEALNAAQQMGQSSEETLRVELSQKVEEVNRLRAMTCSQDKEIERLNAEVQCVKAALSFEKERAAAEQCQVQHALKDALLKNDRELAKASEKLRELTPPWKVSRARMKR